MSTPTINKEKEEEIREFLIKLSQIRASLTKINEILKSETIKNWIEDIDRLQDILEKKFTIIDIRVILPTMKTELAFRNFEIEIDNGSKLNEISYDLVIDKILQNEKEIIRKLLIDIDIVLTELFHMTNVVINPATIQS